MTALPTYLNEEFFREALANSHPKDAIKIKDLQIVRNTAGGNYCSDIYRVSIKYTLEEENAVEKVAKLLVKDLFEHLAENSRELFMYETVLPAFNATLKQFGLDKPVSPRLHLSCSKRGETHVFDDLNEQGYVICDRLLGYDEAQAKMVLWKLGQFHAASMIYKEEHSDIVDAMKEFFCKSDPNFMTFIETLINENTSYVVKIVETWPGYEEIARKMRENTGKNFKRKFLSILNKEDAPVRVIAHGDLWIKNILVLETPEEGVTDAVFLDYQNSFDGSPAFDINNVLMTSVQLEVLKTKRLELISHYHESLSATLVACGYGAERIPALQSIVDEVRRIEYFTYYALIFAFPQTNLSEELAQGMDLAGLFNPKCMAINRKDMFSNKRVLDTFAYELKRLNDLGVLD